MFHPCGGQRAPCGVEWRKTKQNKKRERVAYMRRKVFFFDGGHTLEVAVLFDFLVSGWWYYQGARRATGTPAF